MKVLIAVDGEPESDDAVSFAKRVLPGDAEIIVLSVVQWSVTPYGSLAGWAGPMGEPIALGADRLPEAEDEARQQGETTAHRAGAGLGDAEERVEFGDAGPVICDVAASESADLIVLGTHDRGRWSRLWFGSVSDHVVHHAPCPVLVVRS